jgi:hypothetical protein
MCYGSPEEDLAAGLVRSTFKGLRQSVRRQNHCISKIGMVKAFESALRQALSTFDLFGLSRRRLTA